MDKQLIDDCKKFLGLPPYNTWTNVVCGDIYFRMDMVRKYGEEQVVKAIKELEKRG